MIEILVLFVVGIGVGTFGTLIGIGGAEKPKHVKWKVASSIVGNWFTNIPISMAIGALYCIILLLILS